MSFFFDLSFKTQCFVIYFAPKNLWNMISIFHPKIPSFVCWLISTSIINIEIFIIFHKI